jgi:hypothetical protein
MSASAYATFDQPAPRVGVSVPADLAERHAAIRARVRGATQPKFWTDMDITVRIVLVMIASDQKGDAARIARQSWDSFSPADQMAMASAARLIVENLKPFAAVA